MIFNLNLSGGRGEAPGTARHAASASWRGRRFALYALRRTEAVQGAKGGAPKRCRAPRPSVHPQGAPALGGL